MIRLIYAAARNNVIGHEGKILWYLPVDLKHFKELTENHIVIMGRKTYDSIPLKFRPFKNRQNVVITNNRELFIPFVDIQYSLTAAIEKYINDKRDIFIIGGESLLKEGLDIAEQIDLTFVKIDVVGDTFGPEIDYTKYCITDVQSGKENDIDYSFLTIKNRLTYQPSGRRPAI